MINGPLSAFVQSEMASAFSFFRADATPWALLGVILTYGVF